MLFEGQDISDGLRCKRQFFEPIGIWQLSRIFSSATTFPFRGKCCANIILSVGPEFRGKKVLERKKP